MILPVGIVDGQIVGGGEGTDDGVDVGTAKNESIFN